MSEGAGLGVLVATALTAGAGELQSSSKEGLQFAKGWQ